MKTANWQCWASITAEELRAVVDKPARGHAKSKSFAKKMTVIAGEKRAAKRAIQAGHYDLPACQPGTKEIFIERLPLSPNRTNGHHWAIFSREREAWFRWFWATWGTAPDNWPRTPRALTVVQYRSRLLDPDNLAGSVKPLIDALRGRGPRSLGWLVDDAPAWLKLAVDQCKSKDRMGVLVRLE